MRTAYSFDDVLLVPQYSEVKSRQDCKVSVSLPNLNLDIPIFAANMDTICGPKMAAKMESLGGCGIIHRYMKVSETHNLIRAWFRAQSSASPLVLAVGALTHDKRRIDTIIEAQRLNTNIGICVDLAHGDSKHMLETLEYIRYVGFEGLVIAGNVCTFDGATRLFDGGADIVKVGVGGGSACTTRIKTGCGYPQLAAVEECAKAGPIIADGGIRNYGDAAKALAVGADSVMIGGLLAGTDCTPKWERPDEELEFRGMASQRARESCGASASNAEGISTSVISGKKGSTQRVVKELVEGIKSAMSYSGARTIREFWDKSIIVNVTSSTHKENRPHFIT